MFGTGRAAFRSQLPMLVGMICFSVFSLRLLKRPMEMCTSTMCPLEAIMFSQRQFLTRVGRTLTSNVISPCEVVGRSASAIADCKEEPRPRWLRPPGAVEEKAFLSACTQCTDCQMACPYDSIRRLGPEFGANAGTPAIIPDESPCYLCEDMPCITACEPGALRPLERRDVAMGLAVLEREERCVARGQPCEYCL